MSLGGPFGWIRSAGEGDCRFEVVHTYSTLCQVGTERLHRGKALLLVRLRPSEAKLLEVRTPVNPASPTPVPPLKPPSTFWCANASGRCGKTANSNYTTARICRDCSFGNKKDVCAKCRSRRL